MPPNVKTAPILGEGAAGEDLHGLKQHPARGPRVSAKISLDAAVKQPRACAVCGGLFTPVRGRFRRCLDCSRTLKAALVEHARKRNMDGCIVFRLMEHLHALRSDDPQAQAWLASLAEKPADL